MTTRQRALAQVLAFILCALVFLSVACDDGQGVYEQGGRQWITGQDGLPREWK